MKKPALIISACLTGVPCRYDGLSKPLKAIRELQEMFELVPVCPEIDGGLPVPRPPAEIRRGRVINAEGDDVTEVYEKGANIAVVKAYECGAKYALLKQRSPSCGTEEIYDGTFSGATVIGEGKTASALRSIGVICFSEEKVVEFLNYISAKQTGNLSKQYQ